MDEAPEGDVGSLKFLRVLVTTLMMVMIAGFIVLIVLLVTRLPSTPDFALPEAITLPDGSSPVAVTITPAWYGVVTAQDQFLVYDRETGSLVKTIDVIGED